MNPKALLTKYQNMSAPVKASVWYSVCNILQRGISFIVVPIYVRLLTTSEYGRYTVFQSWRDVLIVFATLNLYSGIFTKAMVEYKDRREQYTSCMQGLSTILTLALLLLYSFSPKFWNGILDMGSATVILLFAYYLFYPSFQFWSVRQRVEYKYRCMIVVTLAASVLTPLISVALFYFTDLREKAVIWGFLFVQIAVGAFFYVFNFIKGRSFFHKDFWIYALKFNIPLIPHYLSLMVLGQADRIMIKAYCGDDKAGIYSLTYSVSQLMSVFTTAINSTLTPWVYERLKNKEYQTLAKSVNGLCALVGSMTVGVMMICPEIVRILGTEEYQEAIWVIPSVALSVYFIFCYGIYSCIEYYYNTTGYVMVASTVCALLNVVLNAVFIPRFGFIAAGYTTLACYIVLLLMHYYFCVKVSRKWIGVSSVLDDKTVALMSLVFVAMVFVCLLLYRNTFVRYGVILIALFIVFLFRKKVLSVVKTFL